MNRWLFLATIVFSCGIVAAAPAPVERPLPVKGEVVSIDRDTPFDGLPDHLRNRMRNALLIGDPDSPDFGKSCWIRLPCRLTVLGTSDDPTLDDTIVVEFRTPNQRRLGPTPCVESGVLLLSHQDWRALKDIESGLAQLKADERRRREAVRAVIEASRPTQPVEKK